MKKVAICTLFHRNYNYGGMLQGYALQQIIRKLGMVSSIVRYDDGENINPIYPTLQSRLIQYSFFEICAKFSEMLLAKMNRGTSKKLAQRIQLFELFMNTYIKSTKLVDDTNIERCGKEYDAFICGSDQVWNPNAVRKLYLLDFPIENNEQRKISYAASISRNRLTEKEKAVMIPAIKRFDAISVREKSAARILSYSGVNDVSVVLDPTFLLEQSDWDAISPNPLTKKTYVFLYSFSNCGFKKELAEYYKKRGIEVYYLPYAKQQYNIYDKCAFMHPVWNAGPLEFVSLIKNAECVYTDSFHGAVFSIIFNKDFIVYERDGNGKTSKNSRMHDLLETFGLQDRLLSGCFKEMASKHVDYEPVNEKLQALRQQSISWLKNALCQ